MSETDLETRVAMLEAAEAVRALVGEYCALADARSDATALAALFTTDAVLLNAAGEFGGRDAITGFFLTGFAAPVEFSRHHVTNQTVEVSEPGLAVHRAHWLVFQGAAEESRLMFGSYQDTAVRTGDGWRFSRKVHVTGGITTLAAGWAHGFQMG